MIAERGGFAYFGLSPPFLSGVLFWLGRGSAPPPSLLVRTPPCLRGKGHSGVGGGVDLTQTKDICGCRACSEFPAAI